MENHYSQVHTPPASLLRQGSLIHTAGWMGHETDQDVLEKRKISGLSGNQIPGCPAHDLLITPTELSWLSKLLIYQSFGESSSLSLVPDI